MNITRARLKEIINEELEREMTPEESAADGLAAAAEMKDRIAQHRASQPSHASEVGSMRAKLAIANNKLDIAHEKAKLHGQTPEIVEVVDSLRETIEELEYMLEFPD
tara:strand:+ start:828 stop:1148 length:321 start_codon:yes stop_codon:yes gene_type:complete